MKKFEKLFAFLLAVLMIADIAGCGNSQAEDIAPEEVVEDAVPADADESVEDPAEEEPEVVTLTEEELKDFVQFSNLYVQRRELEDEDITETDEIPQDAESEDVAEESDDSEEEEVTEDAASEIDAESEDETDEESAELEEIVDPDPYGYLAAVKVLNPMVVRDIAYDDTLVDVRVVGDYELFYLAIVDEDAYNEALLSPDPVMTDSEESAIDEEIEDDPGDTENADEPPAELSAPEHIIYGEIHKVVRVVDPEEYDEMLENGDIVEVVDGTAVLAPESEIEESNIEDVVFTRPEGYKDSTSNGNSATPSYMPTFKDESGNVINVPKPTPTGGGGNTKPGNNNSDNNSDDTGSENAPKPEATTTPTNPTEKPTGTETPNPQDTTKPTATTHTLP